MVIWFTMFDFNKVRAVSHSQPCSPDLMTIIPYDAGDGHVGEDLYPMDLQEQVEYIARVSNPASQGKH